MPPGKSSAARRRLLIDQVRPASTGVVSLVDIVAVKAEAGLEPQRVARAEAGGDHAGLGQQGFGEGLLGVASDGTEIS